MRIKGKCEFPTVVMGCYELPSGMKPNSIHVKTPIEWLVLDIDVTEGKALLVSKNTLDWEGFSNAPIMHHGVNTCWKDSYLRIWLNDQFYQTGFTEKEKSRILEHEVVSIGYEGEETTQDCIFLLSYEEIKKYFKTTEQAIAKMIYVDSDFDALEENEGELFLEITFEEHTYWTRTPGSDMSLVICVDEDGDFFEIDGGADEMGVRPAMWVKLS